MSNILTPREKEIFQLLIDNYNTKDIASFLNISEKTVRNHISNAIQKLGVKGRASAIASTRVREMSLLNMFFPPLFPVIPVMLLHLNHWLYHS